MQPENLHAFMKTLDKFLLTFLDFNFFSSHQHIQTSKSPVLRVSVT